MEKTIKAMNAPGYETLAAVLVRAYDQAAYGKGKERHANDEPFDKQVMQTGAHRFGTGALLFQAFKKSEESQRLPQDRAIAELLGAINYLAGAVIAMEAKQTPVAANDNGVGIAWAGGENPAPGKVVNFTRRFDGEYLARIAHSDGLDWSHGTHGVDDWIVAYTIVGEARNA